MVKSDRQAPHHCGTETPFSPSGNEAQKQVHLRRNHGLPTVTELLEDVMHISVSCEEAYQVSTNTSKTNLTSKLFAFQGYRRSHFGVPKILSQTWHGIRLTC